MNEDIKKSDNKNNLPQQTEKKQDSVKEELKTNSKKKKEESNNSVEPSLEKSDSKTDQKSKSNPVKEIKNIDKDQSLQTDKTKKISDEKIIKTLTSSPQKPKKANDSENKQNDAKSNQSEAASKFNEQGEYIEKLVSINRVAKVVKGGRRFSFAALVVVGDGNGMVGHGKGKAKEVPEAIKKATEEAKIKMIRVPLRQGRTLHHDIKGRFDSGKVYLRSAPSGTGVIAGGPMRAVFEALGIQDIVAKSVGTSNPHNMVRATFEALKSASSPKIIAVRRSLKINDITKRRKISQSSGENVKN